MILFPHMNNAITVYKKLFKIFMSNGNTYLIPEDLLDNFLKDMRNKNIVKLNNGAIINTSFVSDVDEASGLNDVEVFVASIT